MNNWRCKLRRHNPRPVILVHGTFVSQSSSWGSFSPALHNQGFCVFGLTYSALDLPFLPWRIGGMTGIPQGADELAAFVSRVRKATGANKVDLVGHSQGGTVIAYYLKFRGGARSTANAISLAGPVNEAESRRLLPELIAAYFAAHPNPEIKAIIARAMPMMRTLAGMARPFQRFSRKGIRRVLIMVDILGAIR